MSAFTNDQAEDLVASGAILDEKGRLRIPEWQFSEAMYYTDDGRPWRLHKMQFFKAIYDANDDRLLLKTSRQSTKTTLLRNKLATRSLTRRGNSALYLAPTGNQVSEFSKKKLDTVFTHNAALKKYSLGGDWNVTFKQCMLPGGMSTINLRSTGGHPGAEGIRGGTYNDIFKDEYQSLLEEHLPVIDECAATFSGPDAPFQAYFCNTGTPLSFDNPIEKEWNASKGYEWRITCPHCGYMMEPIGMHNLDPGRNYLFCTRKICGRNVYRRTSTRQWDDEKFDKDFPRIPPKGMWVPTNPNGKFPGFRIVRMMMPWSSMRNGNGTGVLDRLDSWPERKFQNEIMGLPFEGGTQPFPESALRACCSSPDPLPRTETEEYAMAAKYAQFPKFMGLDWAMSEKEDAAAYTVYGIFALVNGKLRLIYAHKFVGLGSSDPEFIQMHIGTRMERFSVNLLMADFGMGHWEDRRLQASFPGRVAIAHYTGGANMAKSNFDPVSHKWIIPKTGSMMNLEVAVKGREMEFPDWEYCEAYLKDFLRVTVEVSDATRSVVYRKSGTDDFAHVANYAYLAMRLYRSGEMNVQSAMSGSANMGPVGVYHGYGGM